jgi:flagellar protein FlaG
MMNINAITQPVAESPQPASIRTPVTPAAHIAPVAPATDPQARAARAEAVQEAVTAANDAMQAIKSELQFSTDQTTGKTIVRVVDGETGEVIRQMPSKEIIEIAKALDRLQGLLVRNKA